MKKLSHLDERGRARMVDVGSKPVTPRRAVASGLVAMSAETIALVTAGDLPKGDALAVARIAGIQGAKQTAALIPLCHPLPLDQVRLLARPEPEGVRLYAEARTQARTGVEMEALTAVAVAGLALIDMVKGVERGVTLAEVRLELKAGGKTGRWSREGFADPFAEASDGDAGA
jgi:cyclic pyranopterin phosphate synthase